MRQQYLQVVVSLLQYTKTSSHRVFITPLAANDLNWWRALVLVAYKSPELIVVSIECDNTSAVSWILKNRVKRGGEGVDAVAKTFTLFCLTHNIKLLCKHISGVDNIVADFNSRDLTLMSQDGDEELFHGTQSKPSRRQVSCRRLLHDCLLNPEQTHGLSLLKTLTRVRGEGGLSIAALSK